MSVYTAVCRIQKRPASRRSCWSAAEQVAKLHRSLSPLYASFLFSIWWPKVNCWSCQWLHKPWRGDWKVHLPCKPSFPNWANPDIVKTTGERLYISLLVEISRTSGGGPLFGKANLNNFEGFYWKGLVDFILTDDRDFWWHRNNRAGS